MSRTIAKTADGVIHVAAAVIRKDGKILICQRPEGKGNALLWEFPGGKLEVGETLPRCLVRECMEELSVAPDVGKILAETDHTYPDIKVHITFFDCTLSAGAGAPVRNEHNAIAFVRPEELDRYSFCPADHEILEILKRA